MQYKPSSAIYGDGLLTIILSQVGQHLFVAQHFERIDVGHKQHARPGYRAQLTL